MKQYVSRFQLTDSSVCQTGWFKLFLDSHTSGLGLKSIEGHYDCMSHPSEILLIKTRRTLPLGGRTLIV